MLNPKMFSFTIIMKINTCKVDLTGNSKYQSDDENEDDKHNVHDDKSYY